MIPCPLCQHAAPTPFYTAQGTPVHQNLIYRTRLEAQNAPQGQLAICLCPRCGFVYNAAFDPALVRYGEDYDNTQTHSAAFLAHVQALAAALTRQFDLAGKTVVEVGCGNGGFLKLLCQGAGCRGVGFDPSYKGPAQVPDAGRGVSFFVTEYGPQQAHTAADLIVCRHVIEHLPQPLKILSLVRQAVARRPQSPVLFETPDVTWILEQGAYWDFFYEHCAYFTPASLRFAFEASGFVVREQALVFGGQYQTLLCQPAPQGAPPPTPPNAEATQQLVHRFTTLSGAALAHTQDFLSRHAQGGVAVWGAGAKGVTLLNLLDKDQSLVRCLVDINPVKQGHFTAGTGHPITPPEHLRQHPPAAILVMNQNYLEEIRQTVAGLVLRCEITPIESLVKH